MKWVLIALMTLSLTPMAQSQQNYVKNRVVGAGELGQYLLELQGVDGGSTGFTLTVISGNLAPAFTQSFNALAHGWCKDPILAWCRPAYFPIGVKIITGEAGRESFRVPATPGSGLPLILTAWSAEVWVLKDNPSKSVWLVQNTDPQKEAIIIGGLLDGSASFATITEAPGLATAMYKQLLLDAVISRATRWTP
jgi:hypothetical protein